MDNATIRSLIETEFTNNWTETQLVYDNVSANITTAEFVRLTIITTSSFNRTIGDDKTLKKGFIVIQVYIPLDIGMGRADELSDLILAILENQRFSDLFTYAGVVEHIGESPTTSFNPAGSGQFRELTPGFFQINVKIPFDAL